MPLLCFPDTGLSNLAMFQAIHAFREMTCHMSLTLIIVFHISDLKSFGIIVHLKSDDLVGR